MQHFWTTIKTNRIRRWGGGQAAFLSNVLVMYSIFNKRRVIFFMNVNETDSNRVLWNIIRPWDGRRVGTDSHSHIHTWPHAGNVPEHFTFGLNVRERIYSSGGNAGRQFARTRFRDSARQPLTATRGAARGEKLPGLIWNTPDNNLESCHVCLSLHQQSECQRRWEGTLLQYHRVSSAKCSLHFTLKVKRSLQVCSKCTRGDGE